MVFLRMIYLLIFLFIAIQCQKYEINEIDKKDKFINEKKDNDFSKKAKKSHEIDSNSELLIDYISQPASNKVRININVIGKRIHSLSLSYLTKSLSNIDMRYRKLGTDTWKRVYNIGDLSHNGFAYNFENLDIDTDYEVQLSYAWEAWSYENFFTYIISSKSHSSERENRLKELFTVYSNTDYTGDSYTFKVNSFKEIKAQGNKLKNYKIPMKKLLQTYTIAEGVKVVFTHSNGSNLFSVHDLANKGRATNDKRKAKDNVKFNYDGFTIKLDSKYPFDIDMRYRKLGDTKWTQNYNAPHTYTPSDLVPYTDYEVQFVYYYEPWPRRNSQPHRANTYLMSPKHTGSEKRMYNIFTIYDKENYQGNQYTLKVYDPVKLFSRESLLHKIDKNFDVYIGSFKIVSRNLPINIYRVPYTNSLFYVFGGGAGNKAGTIRMDKIKYFKIRHKVDCISNTFITNVRTSSVSNGVKIYFKNFSCKANEQCDPVVDMLYRMKTSRYKYRPTNWIKVSNIQSGYVLHKWHGDGLNSNTEYEFKIKLPSDNNSCLNKYYFKAPVFKYRLANQHIYDVDIEPNKNAALFTYKQSKSSRVDLRYRVEGSGTWIKKNNIPNEYEITNLSSNTKYQFQFVFGYESWGEDSLHKSYHFKTLSNHKQYKSKLKDHNSNSIGNVRVYCSKKSGKYLLAFKKKRKHYNKRLDIRYRRIDSKQWIKKYNIRYGFNFIVDNNSKYEFQLSIEGEWWSWGGYKTYYFYTGKEYLSSLKKK